jgi:hypothetical protein
MTAIYYLLGFHMHRPPGNLELLIQPNEWEARQIMLCYGRPLKYAWRYQEWCGFTWVSGGTCGSNSRTPTSSPAIPVSWTFRLNEVALCVLSL